MLRRKTIKFAKEDRVEADDTATREATYERVARAVERSRRNNYDPRILNAYEAGGIAVTELLVAPPGSHKSTSVRANAVQRVQEHPGESVVILMPRHKLGDEQILDLRREHPNANFSVAVWRGRQAFDPEEPHPQREGVFRQMCWRADEALELEKSLIDVESHLCQRGRGKKKIKCPFFDQCGYQRRKQTEADIWFAAHEIMVHEMPKAFGKVGWVVIDESPLDAFMFGIGIDDQVTLELDALRSFSLPAELNDAEADELRDGRMALVSRARPAAGADRLLPGRARVEA